MSDKKISQLTALTGANVAADDVLAIVDTNATETKKIRADELFKSLSAGTALLPAIAPAADQNTGMWFPAADTIAASTAGSERMRITSTGSVGIGVSSPASLLEVAGNIRSSGTVQNRSVLLVNNTNTFEVANRADISTAILSTTAYPLSLSAGGANFVSFTTNSLERARIDSSGNLLLAGTATPATGVGTLAIFNGTAPTASVTNGIVLYAEDVSASSELKVRDEAGNVTTLSPHNFSMIPEGASEDMAWAYYSERNGKKINVDMLKLARMVEKLTGEKLVYTD